MTEILNVPPSRPQAMTLEERRNMRVGMDFAYWRGKTKPVTGHEAFAWLYCLKSNNYVIAHFSLSADQTQIIGSTKYLYFDILTLYSNEEDLQAAINYEKLFGI